MQRHLREERFAYLIVELSVPDVLSLYRSHDEKERGKGRGREEKEKVVGASSSRSTSRIRGERAEETCNQLSLFLFDFLYPFLGSSRSSWRCVTLSTDQICSRAHP